MFLCQRFFSFLLLFVHSFGADLVVETKNGKVRGREAQTVGLNVTYYAYQGIPYAEPPIGNLRFEPPVPKKNWSGTFNATKDGNICVQQNPPIGSEDCLNLNVYVPQTSNSKVLLPIMIWIYGGGFVTGEATYSTYGPDYLIEKGVIVVSVNYRLGIFGFLSTGDRVVSGNGGLKDQLLALHWVKHNIEFFGGDSNQVTIFGESAGAASVSYHLQSKLSRGLFQRAIIESGVTLSSWTLSRTIPLITKLVAAVLLLDTSSSQKMVDGLKKVNYTVLQTTSTTIPALQYILEDPRYGLIYGPVNEPEHENAFFSGKSYESLTNGDFSRVPVIIGFNSLEIVGLVGELNALLRLYVSRFDIDPTNLVPIDLNVDDSKKKSVGQQIKQYYFGNGVIFLSDRQLYQFFSDDLFVRPSREFVRQVSKYAPVYFYRFSYEGKLSGVQNRTQPGVGHTEELYYIWRTNNSGSKADYLTRERVTTLWTNFAKTGHPTPVNNLNQAQVSWPQSDRNFTFLDIGRDLVVRQFPEEGNMNFWDQIYGNYGNRPFDTY